MGRSYRERDYVFGQAMLNLRIKIGLTQVRLASHLGVSQQAVVAWEGGSNYPKAGHLKEVIALAVQQQAFTAGHEAEEIRVLWKVAHQKVWLDERWLSILLAEQRTPVWVKREFDSWGFPPELVKLAQDTMLSLSTLVEQGRRSKEDFRD